MYVTSCKAGGVLQVGPNVRITILSEPELEAIQIDVLFVPGTAIMFQGHLTVYLLATEPQGVRISLEAPRETQFPGDIGRPELTLRTGTTETIGEVTLSALESDESLWMRIQAPRMTGDQIEVGQIRILVQESTPRIARLRIDAPSDLRITKLVGTNADPEEPPAHERQTPKLGDPHT